MRVAVVVPAYNEESTISSVVKGAGRYGSVIVVDDASSDGTAGAAKKSGAEVVRHKTNRGLGAALRTGFKEALKTEAEIIITIDADGQHEPEEIPKFISAIEAGYEFVLGRRNLGQYPFIKRLGNFFLRAATNFISGTRLRDTESGFRAFSRDALKKLYLKAERYEIAVEIIFEVGRNRLRATNVPISSPVYVKGVGMRDGMDNFIYLLRRRERGWWDYLKDTKYVLKRNLPF